MKRSFAKARAALFFAVMSAAVALAGPLLSVAEPKDAIALAEELSEAWLLEEARSTLDRLSTAERNTARAKLAEGRLLFYRGDAAAALPLLRAAIEEEKAELGWKGLRNRVEAAAAVLSQMERKKGPSGHFQYSYAPGVDALLVPYAEQALEAQRAALAKVFGHAPSFPVEVVFAPDEDALSALSGLTTEQIERTGTVGVSKYGRILLLSPRRLSTGYPWLETLAHELTHVFLSRASRDAAPIWLHEGTAKLFEQRWKGVPLAPLTPEEAYLLDRAAREGRLIPLRRLHPSIAHLPSQEDAALAYAETSSLIRYLIERAGDAGLKLLFEQLATGVAIDQALEVSAKLDMKRLQNWWKQDTTGTRQTPAPVVQLLSKRFKRGKTTSQASLESLLEPEVRKLLRVGDLLRLRGHARSAVFEYREASALMSSPTPVLTDRLAACLLELGEPAEVERLLLEIAELYPNHATVHVQLGQAYDALGRLDESQASFRRALSLSPFHPALHCALASVYERAGHADAAMAKEHCRLLSVHASQL